MLINRLYKSEDTNQIYKIIEYTENKNRVGNIYIIYKTSPNGEIKTTDTYVSIEEFIAFNELNALTGLQYDAEEYKLLSIIKNYFTRPEIKENTLKICKQCLSVNDYCKGCTDTGLLKPISSDSISSKPILKGGK